VAKNVAIKHLLFSTTCRREAGFFKILANNVSPNEAETFTVNPNVRHFFDKISETISRNNEVLNYYFSVFPPTDE